MKPNPLAKFAAPKPRSERNFGADCEETFAGTVTAVTHHDYTTRATQGIKSLIRFVLRDDFGEAVNVAYIFNHHAAAAYLYAAQGLVEAYASAFPENADAFRFEVCGLPGERVSPPTNLNETPLAMLQDLVGLRFIVTATRILLKPLGVAQVNGILAVDPGAARFLTRYTWARDRS